MAYILKKQMVGKLKKYKNNYFVEKMELCPSYISQMVNGKRKVPKTVAYMFASINGENLTIDDIFDKVK